MGVCVCGGETGREREGVSIVFFFSFARTPRSFLFFFSLEKKRNHQLSYRVRAQQHLAGEAVALLRQSDVADACFVVLKRAEENEIEKMSFFFSSIEKQEPRKTRRKEKTIKN